MAITPEKAEKIAQGYVLSGYNKREGLRTVYPEPTCKAGNMVKLVYSNLLVKNEIALLEAEIKEKAQKEGITAEELTKRYNRIAGKAETKADFVNALRANENLSKHTGYYEADNAQNRPQIAIVTGADRLLELDKERALIVESEQSDLAVDG